MSTLYEERPYYICNALKNSVCKCTGCGVYCFLTSNKKYALNGIRINNEEEYNELKKAFGQKEDKVEIYVL